MKDRRAEMALPVKRKTAVIIAGIIVLLAAAGLAATVKGGSMFGKKRAAVGTDIKQSDITEFYYTYDSSVNPPEFQRYRFYAEDGSFFFYHEKREGDHWPLREEDATVKGTLSLSEAEWQEFYSYLEEGYVTKREESIESGDSGPFLFLYWKNDKGTMQVFHFASYEKQKAMEAFCINLKAEQTGHHEGV